MAGSPTSSDFPVIDMAGQRPPPPALSPSPSPSLPVSSVSAASHDGTAPERVSFVRSRGGGDPQEHICHHHGATRGGEFMTKRPIVRDDVI